MLKIECETYLAEVRRKADEMGIRKRLEERLEYLANYACWVADGSVEGPPQPVKNGYEWPFNYDWPREFQPDRTQCVLMKDHAPLSFYFLMQRKQPDGSYRTWFNGGCIYFGPYESGAGAPQFSVRFGEDETKADWSIHT